jgi:hypothetical protein
MLKENYLLKLTLISARMICILNLIDINAKM